jgi:hypothetical protein
MLERNSQTVLGTSIIGRARQRDRGLVEWFDEIAELEQRGDWCVDGCRSMTHWLAYFCRMSRVTAKDKLRVARALRSRPLLSDALADGRVSYSHVRAITRLRDADAATDAALIEAAGHGTVEDVERIVRHGLLIEEQDQDGQGQQRWEQRGLRVIPRFDGTQTIEITALPEDVDRIAAALDALLDHDFWQCTPDEATTTNAIADRIRHLHAVPVDSAETEPAESRVPVDSAEAAPPASAVPVDSAEADHAESVGPVDSAEAAPPASAVPVDSAEAAPPASAVPVDSAEAASAVPVDSAEPDDTGSDLAEDCAGSVELLGDPDPKQHRTVGQRRLDALLDLIEAGVDRLGDDGAIDIERAALNVMIDYPILFQDARGTAETSRGTPLTGDDARRLACDAGYHRIITHGRSMVLDVGRKTQSWNPAQRRAIRTRHGHQCCVGGCGSRITEIHHVEFFSQGGETNIDCGLPVCKFHHHLVHDYGWILTYDPATGITTTATPDGTPVIQTPSYNPNPLRRSA